MRALLPHAHTHTHWWNGFYLYFFVSLLFHFNLLMRRPNNNGFSLSQCCSSQQQQFHMAVNRRLAIWFGVVSMIDTHTQIEKKPSNPNRIELIHKILGERCPYTPTLNLQFFGYSSIFVFFFLLLIDYLLSLIKWSKCVKTDKHPQIVLEYVIFIRLS